EQALPPLAAVAPDPELSGGRPEVEGWRGQLVEVHRIAQHGEIALFLRQPLRELLPRAAAVFAAPNSGRAARTGARRGLERHHVDRARGVRMHDDWEAGGGRESLADRSSCDAVIIASQDPGARCVGKAA